MRPKTRPAIAVHRSSFHGAGSDTVFWRFDTAIFYFPIADPSCARKGYEIANRVPINWLRHSTARGRPARNALASEGGEIMDFISILSIFVLACFVGYYVVWSVTPALHTPLMS